MFALIINGTVVQTAAAEFPVNPALTWVDISTVSPAPQPGWTYSGGTFAAPVVPPLPAQTLAQQAAAAISAGLTVTSTSNPALNGTYACDATAQSHLMAEMIALLNSSGATFADGTASIVWPNITGSLHTYTPAQFQPLALAIGAYVSALYKCINGVLATLPPAAVTIA
jgi:hypothetical protein